jgi:hypothetical protein
MSFFHKKPDPISERARVLTAEIAALEQEIQKLGSRLQQGRQEQDGPRLRSATLPQGSSPHRSSGMESTHAGPAHDPIFEDVDQDRLQAKGEAAVAPEHFNELGVRKYDLPALLRRIRSHFRGPSTSNPKLVNYLAAGGIHGLRPMRYEKRIARNRFIALSLGIFAILLGFILVFVKHH